MSTPICWEVLLRRPRCRSTGRTATTPNPKRILNTLNDATIVAEDRLRPFRKDSTGAKTQHMNLHNLPWPHDELQALGEADVQLRITLSYFVEPNPGERGWQRRHRYQSHNLRFALKRSDEELVHFRARINRAVTREEDALPVAEGAKTIGILDRYKTRGQSILISGVVPQQSSLDGTTWRSIP